MSRERTDEAVAVDLMRMALAFLDRAGHSLAAARLQHAIDTAEGNGPARWLEFPGRVAD